MDEQYRYLTPREAAARLGLNARTLMRKRKEGNGPAFCKIGQRVLYRVVDIESWLMANRYQHQAEMLAGRSAK